MANARAAFADKVFGLSARDTSVRTEFLAGLTTFLTMSYIIFVNPVILKDAGMDQGSVLVATCLAAAVGCLVMGFYANLPVALAPAMGTNVYFTYGIVLGLGVTWQTALGAVFLSGILFVALSISPARAWIINAIPQNLKMAMAAGVGLFLIIVGLRSAGLIVDHPATLVTVGDLSSMEAILAVSCFILIGTLDARKVPGALLLGIIIITIIGAVLGLGPISGIVSAPPDMSPTWLAMDVATAFDLSLAAVVLSLLFVDTFETAGTLVGVTQPAGLVDEDGNIPNLSRAMFADSIATVAGAVVGTSSTTSYVESVSGVRAGGRTGLTAVVVGCLFLVGLFFAPLAGSIQSYATGPAIIYVGCVMAANLAKIDWEDLTTYVPCVVTAVSMPLTYSIATGIGFGFISYAALKLFSGRTREATIGIMVLAGLFLLRFIFL
ncbi:MAG: NCS2 family permease [Pseudomonadota bacterium]